MARWISFYYLKFLGVFLVAFTLTASATTIDITRRDSIVREIHAIENKIAINQRLYSQQIEAYQQSRDEELYEGQQKHLWKLKLLTLTGMGSLAALHFHLQTLLPNYFDLMIATSILSAVYEENLKVKNPTTARGRALLKSFERELYALDTNLSVYQTRGRLFVARSEPSFYHRHVSDHIDDLLSTLPELETSYRQIWETYDRSASAQLKGWEADYLQAQFRLYHRERQLRMLEVRKQVLHELQKRLEFYESSSKQIQNPRDFCSEMVQMLSDLRSQSLKP